jgi:cyclopropane fatty-acyl-phospholipid synthase-like methyltransferase
VTATEDQSVGEYAVPTPEEIGISYDEFADFYRLINSDVGFHIGMWSGSATDDGLSSVYDLSNKAQTRVVEYCIDALKLKSTDHFLDLGCGAGAPTVQIAEHSGATAVGVNVSKVQLAEATGRAEAAGLADRVKFEYGNAMELAYEDETFDAIVAIDLFPHLSDRLQGFKEAYRVLKPGGTLLLSEFTYRGEAPEEQFRAFLETFEGQRPEPPEQSIQWASEAGFELVWADRKTKDVALSTEVMFFLYTDRHAEITERYGEEVVAGLDYVMPLVRAYMRDHLGYYYFLVQKPE